jgi:DnaJ-class molecular chaperone
MADPVTNAVRCPVCGGRGWVDEGWYRGLPLTTRIACPPCDGTGIVWAARRGPQEVPGD